MSIKDTYDDETKAALAELNARGVALPMEWAVLRPETVRFNALQMLKAMPPRVRILHHRDPDESLAVLSQGVTLSDALPFLVQTARALFPNHLLTEI